MKKIIINLAFLLTITSMTQAANNPFFGKYRTPHAAIPFDKIKNAHFEPAFDKAIEELKEDVDKIANSSKPATFENTIVALEQSGELLNKVSSAFFNLLGAESDDEMMEISQRVSPKLSESSSYINLNEALFKRIKAVYEMRATLDLNQEDAKLLEETFQSFATRGANLSPEDKEKYRTLSAELSRLTLVFDQNVLKDENSYELLITNEADLAGLPESVREAASLKAKNKEKSGWMFDLSYPSYVPFVTYAENRSLREELYRAKMGIGSKGDQYDNKENIKNIVNTRLAIAQLMGHKSYADYTLSRKMAKNPANVYKLLNQLLDAFRPVAVNEYNKVEGYAMGMEQKNLTLMPWDWGYYAEKLKDATFDLNDEMSRPYFELSNVKKGVFGLATQLYGITFKKNNNIPVYHADVDAYEVFDEAGNFLSILYTDFHPREGKQSGAWMNSMKGQFKEGKEDSRPHIVIVMNFTPPTESKPSLLSFDEVETFLHEFGHALHGMLADGTYESLSGTSVYRDFVELPSQIMENWLTEKEFLDQIAVHYETGEKIPAELVKKLVDAANYNTGYTCLRQLSFGLLDMGWHTIEAPFTGDVVAFEKRAWNKAQLLTDVPNTLMSSSFGHIFAGGYAAGYYGYKWAEVLDADAFAAFKEAGIFNKEVAKSFRDNVLSRGGVEDPMELYIRFRGQEPSIDALLKRSGLSVEAAK